MCVFAHQWVCVAVALRWLFPDAFSRGRVAIEPHILRAELQQRGPLSRSGRSWPRVSVNHPGSRVLPRRPAAVQLQRRTEFNTETYNKVIWGRFRVLGLNMRGTAAWRSFRFSLWGITEGHWRVKMSLKSRCYFAQVLKKGSTREENIKQKSQWQEAKVTAAPN